MYDTYIYIYMYKNILICFLLGDQETNHDLCIGLPRYFPTLEFHHIMHARKYMHFSQFTDFHSLTRRSFKGCLLYIKGGSKDISSIGSPRRVSAYSYWFPQIPKFTIVPPKPICSSEFRCRNFLGSFEFRF